MATGQQTFTLGEELKGAFRRFCEDQGLDPKLVFLAGWRALHKAENGPRQEWFEGIAAWQQEITAEWGRAVTEDGPPQKDPRVVRAEGAVTTAGQGSKRRMKEA